MSEPQNDWDVVAIAGFICATIVTLVVLAHLTAARTDAKIVECIKAGEPAEVCWKVLR